MNPPFPSSHSPIPPNPPSRGQTLSPVSTTGSEWSGINGYQSMPRSQSPYSPIVGPGMSPERGPMNGSPNGLPMAPNARRPSAPASQQQPSPPASIANSRSSDGTLSDQQSRKYKRMEDQLAQHYEVLRRYLNGGQPQPPRPNKARDKLLRLSATQFHELSTDVYDELIRRQASTPPRPPPGRPPQRPPNVPPYLLPRNDFHEKRNQARQKLSSLQPQRFRDLGTDVFCELERRFVHFKNMNMNMNMSRRGSPAPSMNGGFPPVGPSPNGFRPPPPGGFGPGPRGPGGPGGPGPGPPGRGPGPMGGYGVGSPRYPPRQGSLSSPLPGPDNMRDSRGMGPEGDFGKPTPKQFQSNTITPNKSTMVEDEDDFALYDDPYDNNPRQSEGFPPQSQPGPGMPNRRDTAGTNRSGSSSAANTKLIEAQSRMSELQSQVDDLQLNMGRKDDEIARLHEAEQSRSPDSDWVVVKDDLERRLEEADSLNHSMKDQLDRIQTDQANVERDLRSQLDTAKRSQGSDGGWRSKHDQLDRDHQSLQARLREQQVITEEVRQQASGFLNEMRSMAETGGSTWEREEHLNKDVKRLEEEVQEWKSRYAKSKAQLRNLRASSMGLSITRPDLTRFAKANEFAQPDGLIKDIHITKFQISIDELLRIARVEDPSAVLNHVKSVVLAVRHITEDLDAQMGEDKESETYRQQSRLKSKMSATANNVITASKNFASSNGISPISLLDAAASHLTMAVVELVRTVKIRPTPPGELEEDDEMSVAGRKSNPYFNEGHSHVQTESTNASIYSTISTTPISAGSSGAATTPHLRSASKTSSERTSGTGYGRMSGPEREEVKHEYDMRHNDGDLEDLKLYLEDQTDSLVRSIQSLVGAVRAEAAVPEIRSHIATIADVVGQVVSASENSMPTSAPLRAQIEPIVAKLANCKVRLMTVSTESERLADKGRTREFMSRLPPLAFEIARETKELVQRVDMVDENERHGREDFS